MADFYFKKSDLERLVKSKSNKLILKFLKSNKNKIYLYDTNDINFSPELFSILKGKGNAIRPGVEMIKALEANREEMPLGLSSRSIFFFDEKDKKYEEFAKELEAKLGIKCVFGKKGEYNGLRRGKAIFLDETESCNWENIINMKEEEKKEEMPPCNTIIFNDRYIRTGNIDDIKKIIQNLSRKRASKVSLHILIIYAGNKNNKNDSEYFKELADKVAKELEKDISNKLGCILEFVYCYNVGGKYALYEYTHDRFVISNYTSVDASHALNQRKMQKITVGNLFYEDTLKMTNTLISHIADEILKGKENKDDGKMPYLYIRYDNVNGKFEKKCDCERLSEIQNRFIVERLETQK